MPAIALAEALNARVITDLKIGASFPTDHPLYVGAAHGLTPDSVEALRAADVILSLDWVDLAGALRSPTPRPPPKSFRSRSTTASTTAGAWTTRLCLPSIFSSPPIPIASWPQLVKALGASGRPRAGRIRRRPPPTGSRRASPTSISRDTLAKGRRRAAGDADASADLLGRSLVDVPPSARFSRLRWRRRRRRRPGYFGRRGAGAEEFRPAAGRDLRRRRLPDGRDRGVDGGALQDSAAVRDRQQSLVL